MSTLPTTLKFLTFTVLSFAFAVKMFDFTKIKALRYTPDFLVQVFPPSSNYTTDEVPDLTGKTVLITGGNAGIGFETAKTLLKHNAKVYLACRNQSKTEKAIEALKEQTGGKEAYFLELDLSDLRSVKKSAQDFTKKEQRLDVLYNNAGVMDSPMELITADGYDLQFGTNVLGHFYFTKLLLPTLVSTAKASSDGQARVVTLSSAAHFAAGDPKTLPYETFKDGPARRKSSMGVMYCYSKLGNLIFAKELSNRYKDQGITSIAVHPGNIQSELQRHLSSWQYFFLKPSLYPVEKGALTQIFAGTAPDAKALDGKYLVPWARIGTSSRAAQDPKHGAELWAWLEEQVKPFET